MDDRVRLSAAVAATAALFVLIQLGALALVEPFEAADYRAVEDPSDPTNSAIFLGAILVATGVMLAIIKYDVDWLLRAAIIGVSAMLSWYVVAAIVTGGTVSGGPLDLVPAGVALLVAAGLVVHPEWYVIDTAGVLMGAGAAGLFGISFGLLPALLFLAALAVYDAISVYGTEHMLTLAEGVMDQHLPVLLVVPTTLSYSFLDATPPETATGDEGDGHAAAANGGDAEADTGDVTSGEAPAREDDEDVRDALFIGLGDAVMPTILVASAAFFIPPDVAPRFDVPVIAVNLPALTAMIGTIVGLIVLLRMVLAGRAHAGLPLLNGGTILGYLVGALASGLTLAQAVGLGSF